MFLKIAGCFILFATMGLADTLNAGGTWQTWTAGFPGSTLGRASAPNYGGPYWNNASGDGTAANIGWCLAGGGQCTLSGGSPGTIPFYGGPGGSAIQDMYFTGNHSQITATLEGSLTSQRTNDFFGYYTFDPESGAVLNRFPLLAASSAPGITSVTFTPATKNYGFYLENTQGNPDNLGTFPSEYFFYTDANDNNVLLTANPTDSLQHFAIFSSGDGSPSNPHSNANSAATYYIGAVDTRACSSTITGSCLSRTDFDYQDMVVRLSSARDDQGQGDDEHGHEHGSDLVSVGALDVVTPEPGTLGLLGVSLGILMLWRSKRA